MKILFIAHYFPRPNNTNAGTWALEQAQAFADLGIEVRVVSPIPLIPAWLGRLAKVKESASACPDRHDFGEIRVDYLRWPLYTMSRLGRIFNDDPGRITGMAYPFLASRLGRIVREFAPDIVYAHHAQVGGYIAYRITEGGRTRPYVVTDHSFGELESCAENPRRKAHYTAIASHAAMWVAVSKRMEGIMRRLWPEIPSTTVYNGSNPPRPGNTTPSGGPAFLSVGFMYPRKNMPLLIRAFGRSRAAEHDATLTIAGDGTDYGACQAEVARSPVRERIRLLGSVDHDEALRQMQGCDAFALVGKNEPFGVAYTEAMASGKPILYCSDSGIAEVVQDGVQGLEVPPDDEDAVVAALDRFLDDPDARERMGDAAEALFKERLTWRSSAERMRTIFEEALRRF